MAKQQILRNPETMILFNSTFQQNWFEHHSVETQSDTVVKGLSYI